MNKKSTRRSAPSGEVAERDAIQVVEYEITTQPLDEDRSYKRLPKRVKDAVPRLHNAVQRRPREVIPELEGLIKKYPHIPMFYNYLVVAYSAAGEHEKAEETARKNYERNPDYLFARLNYAELFLRRGEYERVAEIFDHTFDLKLLYPKRKRFHVSEVVGFMGLVGIYFLGLGEREAAERYYEILQQVAPDEPLTVQLGRQLHPGCLLGLLQRLAGNGGAEQEDGET
jgi:tetratricopeptide (TPR) repeat protein